MYRPLALSGRGGVAAFHHSDGLHFGLDEGVIRTVNVHVQIVGEEVVMIDPTCVLCQQCPMDVFSYLVRMSVGYPLHF